MMSIIHENGEKRMLADYHVHTEYSDDSVYPMEEVVKDAIMADFISRVKFYKKS